MVVADMVYGRYGRTPSQLTKREDCHYQTVFFKYLKSFYTNGSDRKQSVFRYKVSGSSNTVLDDTSGTQFTNSLWDYRDGANSTVLLRLQHRIDRVSTPHRRRKDGSEIEFDGVARFST